MQGVSLLLAITASTALALEIPTKEIEDGVNMPYVSIGTWISGSTGEDAALITTNWLAQGFIGIDTAWDYFDQEDIAGAIAASGVPRENLFITTKIPNCAAGNTATYVEADLSQLDTDYLDLVLIHAPGLASQCTKTWEALEEYKAAGKIKSIGVSNWGTTLLQDVLDMATEPIAVNQVRYSVFSHDEELAAFCKEKGITIEAYSPVKDAGGASVFTDETVTGVAQKHNVSNAQVALRWIVQQDHVLTVLSQNPEHQANDADLWSFELDDEDMAALSGIQSQTQALI